MTSPQIVAIILNWNGCEDTIECLESLLKVTYPALRVLVVDNGSTDDSLNRIRSRFPAINLVETGHNLGYAGGNNAGIRLAASLRPAYYLLVNNDVIFDPDSLNILVQAGEGNVDAGILGPKVYFYSNRNVVQSLGADVCIWTGTVKVVSFNKPDQESYKDIREVDYVTGAALLIKQSVIDRIGLVPESYFLYSEEVDFCLRARRSGFKVLAVPGSKIWHKGSNTIGKFTRDRQYFLIRSRFIFEKKFGSCAQKLFFNEWFLLVSLPLEIASRLKERDAQGLIGVLRGFSAGVLAFQKEF